ncbi:protein DOG1-like 4 [Tripterygium wilfordii]|uniref:protein DOG1-like 4 n=1 Tax=Tripterygium wilfordii TaxID=458696 RepID=UPI0018F85F22|nr:protein DOG1-like 4 [Tripterygium wilfordii]
MNSFNRFYDSWLDQLQHLVHHLNSAPKPPTTGDDQGHLGNLVRKVMSHYAEYYRVKSVAAQRDVLGVMAAPWASSLERSLHWIAGWRPTTVFHLIYTESSIMFESHILDILRGHQNGDLGDLSPSQFRPDSLCHRRVSELQCETVDKENALTEEMLEWQDGVSEFIGVCGDLDEMIGRLACIVQKADDLRLRTVKSVVGLLTPQQAGEFFTAAAELQFGVRLWGLNHDRQTRN